MELQVSVKFSKLVEKQFTEKLYMSGIHRALRLDKSSTVSPASADFVGVMRGLLAKSVRDDFSVKWSYFKKDGVNIGGAGYDKTFLMYPKTNEGNCFYLSSKAGKTLFVLDDKAFGFIASMLACEILLKRYSANDAVKDRVQEVLVSYIAIHDAFSVLSNKVKGDESWLDVLEKENMASLNLAFDTLVDADNEIVAYYDNYGDYKPTTERHYPKIISNWLKRKAS